MRVISQDGKCDYPYENSTLFIDYMDGRVIKIVPSTGGCKGTKIATYSTEEKAVKAMEMLREAYGKLEVMKVIANGTAEYMERELNEDEVNSINKQYRNMNVFQFPRDEEIEV
jgi:hypothetical protein